MSYTLTYGNGGLADAAQYIQSKGRNKDTQLVHMTPSEVDALQSLAQQHGGSLTINPHTGLPEAGFLGDILKTGATAAAAYYGGPLLGAAIAPTAGVALQTGLGMGLISGGLTALTTGSLEQGLGAGVIGGIAGGLTAPAAASQTANMATTSGVDAAAQAAALQAQNAAVNTGLNQAGTSMMTNPSILSAGASPVATTASSSPFSGISNWWGGLSGKEKLGYGLAGTAGLGILGSSMSSEDKEVPVDKGTIRPYTYASNAIPSTSAQSPYPTGPLYNAAGNPILPTSEQRYFNQGFTELPAYKAADGGLMAAGGLENMYPQSRQYSNEYAIPISNPISNEVLDSGYEQKVNQYNGEPIGYAFGGMANETDEAVVNNKYTYDPATQKYAQVEQIKPVETNSQRFNQMYINHPLLRFQQNKGMQNVGMGRFGENQNMRNNGLMGGFGGNIENLNRRARQQQAPIQKYTYDPVTQTYKQFANGGIANLGDYSDGGRLLKGPGDGVSDSIPASINNKQPARLADGEFVIPARIVSELGNGSTDAGAKRLYAMMDKIQLGRKKTVGKGKVAVDSKAEKYLPS
jgi:hypothetical protein